MPSIILSDNGVSSGSAGLKTTAASDGALALQTTTAGGSATTAVTIDTSQIVGVGTTSPSSLSSAKLVVSQGSDADGIFLRGGGTRQIMLGTSSTMGYINVDNTSGLGFNVNGPERMRLDTSGALIVGTTATAGKLGVNSASDTAGTLTVALQNGTNAYQGLRLTSTGNALAFDRYNGSWAESARFDINGNLLVGQTAQSNVERLGVTFTGNNEGVYAVNSSASPTGTAITANFPSGTGTNGTGCILYKGRTAGVDRFYVYGNGNVVNTNNSYGALSDVKLKENITDTTPKLAQLNQVRVVNYNLIGDETKQLGVVAQELEQIFPAMVEQTPDRDAEGNDLGTTTKSVKYSVFVPMLIKAIQEQQAIIQQLQADVAALKGN